MRIFVGIILRRKFNLKSKYFFIITIAGVLFYWYGAYVTFRNTTPMILEVFENKLTSATSTIDPISSEEQFISPSKSGFHPEWHPRMRANRFPSIDDRVKLYMSNYYLPPCVGYDSNNESVDERFQYFFDFSDNVTGATSAAYPNVHLTSFDGNNVQILPTKASPDKPFVLWEKALDPLESFNAGYFYDALKIARLAKDLTGKASLEEISPIVTQFGDSESFISKFIPSLHKFRLSAKTIALNQVTDIKSGLDCKIKRGRKVLVTQPTTNTKGKGTLSPIIWLLNYSRHFQRISEVRDVDILWEDKLNQAIWRGAPTGLLNTTDRMKPFDQRCDLLQRCRFVRDNLRNPSLDIGFSFDIPGSFVIDQGHKYMIKGQASLSYLLQYKVIIIMEGNDISSGLKWALYSRSVVMMPIPTKTSFAMEELLEPWIHFVPLKSDFSDLSEKFNWIMNHDEEARKIAERGTLFVHDLLFHKDAEIENYEIQKQILKRYMNFFVSKT